MICEVEPVFFPSSRVYLEKIYQLLDKNSCSVYNAMLDMDDRECIIAELVSETYKACMPVSLFLRLFYADFYNLNELGK